MNRAERRKAKTENKEPTYTVTKSQMLAMQKEYYDKGKNKALEKMKEMRTEITEDILVQLLGYPCLVLSKYYGWGMKKRLPEFVDLMMKEYNTDGMSVEEFKEWMRENIGITFEREEE